MTLHGSTLKSAKQWKLGMVEKGLESGGWRGKESKNKNGGWEGGDERKKEKCGNYWSCNKERKKGLR